MSSQRATGGVLNVPSLFQGRLSCRSQAQVPPRSPQPALLIFSVSTELAMSRFSTMTTGDRKMQAAAICREIQSHAGEPGGKIPGRKGGKVHFKD